MDVHAPIACCCSDLKPCFVLQNLIFRFLQSRQKVQIWLFEQKELRIEGRIIVGVDFTRQTCSALQFRQLYQALMCRDLMNT